MRLLVRITPASRRVWRRRSDSCSTSVAAPSSAQRGSGRRKWHAKIVCETSCGSTESRIRCIEPWISIFQPKTSPLAKLNVVAPPAPSAIFTLMGHLAPQGGIAWPVHSSESSRRKCSAARPISSAMSCRGAWTMKFRVSLRAAWAAGASVAKTNGANRARQTDRRPANRDEFMQCLPWQDATPGGGASRGGTRIMRGRARRQPGCQSGRGFGRRVRSRGCVGGSGVGLLSSGPAAAFLPGRFYYSTGRFCKVDSRGPASPCGGVRPARRSSTAAWS